MKNYQDVIDGIQKCCKPGSKLGLERMRALLRLLGDPQRKLRCLHVAGTNGKGSVCACIESVLRLAGYRTGLFTSPHLFKVNERIQIDRQSISDADLYEEARKILSLLPQMEEPPTEFEFYTAMAFEYFRKKGCDIVILETGLGGRLDATNIIEDPLLSVITTIGLDHMAELGDTIEKIAAEKAGIIKEACDLLVDGRNIDTMDVLIRESEKKHARFHRSCPEEIRERECGPRSICFDYKEWTRLSLPLIGSYQTGNAALAIEALCLLASHGFQIGEKEIREGLQSVQWEGRFELFHSDPPLIIDGSHNRAGMEESLRSLKKLFPDKKIRFILGVLKDKNALSALPVIEEELSAFYLITPPCERALDAGELARLLPKILQKDHKIPIYPFSSVKEALFSALSSASEDEVVIASGSLYSVSALKTAAKEYYY